MRVFLSAAVLLATACAGSVRAPDVGAAASDQSQLRQVVTQHCAAEAPATADACASAMQAYLADARMHAGSLLEAAEGMDACMSAMMGPDQADMQTTCRSLMGELDRHADAGCGADERARHCAALDELMTRMSSRIAQMEAMMDGGGMMGSGGMMGGGGMPGGSCHPQ